MRMCVCVFVLDYIITRFFSHSTHTLPHTVWCVCVFVMYVAEPGTIMPIHLLHIHDHFKMKKQ